MSNQILQYITKFRHQASDFDTGHQKLKPCTQHVQTQILWHPAILKEAKLYITHLHYFLQQLWNGLALS